MLQKLRQSAVGDRVELQSAAEHLSEGAHRSLGSHRAGQRVDQAVEGAGAVADLVIRVDDDRAVLRCALAQVAGVGHLSQLLADRPHPVGKQPHPIAGNQLGESEVAEAGQGSGTETSGEEPRRDRSLHRHPEEEYEEGEDEADEESERHHPDG